MTKEFRIEADQPRTTLPLRIGWDGIRVQAIVGVTMDEVQQVIDRLEAFKDTLKPKKGLIIMHCEPANFGSAD